HHAECISPCRDRFAGIFSVGDAAELDTCPGCHGCRLLKIQRNAAAGSSGAAAGGDPASPAGDPNAAAGSVSPNADAGSEPPNADAGSLPPNAEAGSVP